jgi:hypothetical protein
VEGVLGGREKGGETREGKEEFGKWSGEIEEGCCAKKGRGRARSGIKSCQ